MWMVEGQPDMDFELSGCTNNLGGPAAFSEDAYAVSLSD
jgi:hypothetical protein